MFEAAGEARYSPHFEHCKAYREAGRRPGRNLRACTAPRNRAVKGKTSSRDKEPTLNRETAKQKQRHLRDTRSCTPSLLAKLQSNPCTSLACANVRPNPAGLAYNGLHDFTRTYY
jgi:hypothetical protein